MKLNEYSNTVGVIALNKFKPKLCSDFAIRNVRNLYFFREKQKNFSTTGLKLSLHPENRARNQNWCHFRRIETR